MSQTIGNNNIMVRWSGSFTIVRILLGAILVWKGINLFMDVSIMEAITNERNASLITTTDAVLLLAAGLLTTLAGLLISISNGIFTRIAAFIQLPIVLLGTLFIHGGHIERSAFELILTFTAIFLLLLIIVKGSPGKA